MFYRCKVRKIIASTHYIHTINLCFLSCFQIINYLHFSRLYFDGTKFWNDYDISNLTKDIIFIWLYLNSFKYNLILGMFILFNYSQSILLYFNYVFVLMSMIRLWLISLYNSQLKEIKRISESFCGPNSFNSTYLRILDWLGVLRF